MRNNSNVSKTFFDELDEKRKKTFSEWENAYNTISSELESLIDSLDEIKKIDNPVFQDLTLKFYTIHLCNFFFFHIRKVLVDRNIDNDTGKLLLNSFSNPSNIPSPPVMNHLLSYLIFDEFELRRLCEFYKKIQELRNKYAHGASNETSFNITMDEFREIYESVKKIA